MSQPVKINEQHEALTGSPQIHGYEITPQWQ